MVLVLDVLDHIGRIYSPLNLMYTDVFIVVTSLLSRELGKY